MFIVGMKWAIFNNVTITYDDENNPSPQKIKKIYTNIHCI